MNQKEKDRLISRIGTRILDWAAFAEEQDGLASTICPNEIKPPFARRDGWVRAILVVGRQYDHHIKWTAPRNIAAYKILLTIEEELIVLANGYGLTKAYVDEYGSFCHSYHHGSTCWHGAQFHTAPVAISCAVASIRELRQSYCKHEFHAKMSCDSGAGPGETWYICYKCGCIIDELTEKDNLVPEEVQTE
jgi:hypothetical protein